MGWWIAGAALAGGLSLFQGSQQRSAAQSANKEREKQAKQAFERQKKEYEIGWGQQLTQYAWDQAKTEAMRYQDRQKEALYEQRMSWLAEGAMTNLQLNSEALYDKYVTQENLRARQEQLEFSEQMDSAISAERTEIQNAELQSATVANQAMQAQIETSQQIQSYVRSVQQRAMESARVVQEMNNQSQDLQAELVLDEASDNIQRDIELVAAIEQSSGKRAALAARQGNSSSAVRASANKLQELGRSYGLLSINRQQRGARTAKFNKSLGTTAMQLNEIGNQMASAVDQIKYSKLGLRNKNAGFGLAQMSLANRAAGTTAQFGIKTQSALDRFNDLTLPSFGQARRQGDRELAALVQQTKNTLNEASIPYINDIIFDPLHPIKGLEPEFYEPTKQYVPSMLSIGLNAAGSAFQGAMSMSYNKPGGGIGFH